MMGMIIVVYFFLVGVSCYFLGLHDGKQLLTLKEKEEAIKLQELKINEICGFND